MSTAVSRRRRYTYEEKVLLVEEISRRHQLGEGSLRSIANRLGVSDTSYHEWRREFKGSDSPHCSGTPRVYSDEDRTRLVVEIERLRSTGKSIDAACRIVGISQTSYDNWRNRSASSSMRPVEVTTLVPTTSQVLSNVSSAMPSLILSATNGYRIEGLDVVSAAALLRALA